MNFAPFQSRHTLAGLAAILLWSTTIAFSRTLTEQLGTFTAAAFIYLLAGLVGLVVAGWQQRGSLRRMLCLPKAYLWGCGILFVVYILALYLAVGSAANRTQVLAVGLINYLWPGLSLVFSIPILGRKARPWLPVGIVLALVGVWLATSDASSGSNNGLAAFVNEGALLPYGLALTAAVCWGLYSNLSRRWGGREGDGAVPLFLIASGALLGVMRLLVVEHAQWSPGTMVELGYMAFFPGMLAYVLWDVAMRKGNIILVASLSYLTPLLSTLISTLVLGVTPGTGLWLGALLVMVGALICKFSLPDEQ